MSRFSNFKQYVFRNLFPYYYHDYDTYKDENGKGILERFVEVCFEYFDNDIVPEIDNILDNIDVELCQDIYLSYLWEFLGQPPYANAIQSTYPNPDPRQVLKYAISLYKIRGSELFFKILGRLYNTEITIEVIDSGTDLSDDDGIFRSRFYYRGNNTNQVLTWYGQCLTYSGGKCSICTHVSISLKVPIEFLLEYISKNHYYYDAKDGKIYTDEDKTKEVPITNFTEVQSMINVVKKYLPINTSTKKTDSAGEDTDGDNIIVTIWAPQLTLFSPPNIPQEFTNANLSLPVI